MSPTRYERVHKRVKTEASGGRLGVLAARANVAEGKLLDWSNAPVITGDELTRLEAVLGIRKYYCLHPGCIGHDTIDVTCC